jgi:preprotein translocase subunit SecE
LTETQGTTATPERGRSGGSERREKKGLFSRIALFLRQVRAELFKVIWPTRKELVTYTSVVVVFVAVIMVIVGVLDLGFSKLVLQVFGNG